MEKKWRAKILAMLIVFVLTMVNILPTNNSAIYAASYVEDDILTKESSSLWEKALTAFLLMGTLGLYALIGVAAGKDDNDGGITIESLIFNNYNKTSLNIFSSMPVKDGETYEPNKYIRGDSNQSGVVQIGDRLDDFFAFFTKLAVIAYMMMLVYIGIRILLNAGTEKNAKYKDFLVYWVQGVALLFLFPFVMKYTIVINNAFVEFIAQNKENLLNFGDSFSQPGIPVVNDNATMDDMQAASDGAQLALNEGTDYMSMMFREAEEKGWLVYGICWVIMVKQLLSLLIIYFKRLLMTIFLIAVFPLVMISYAIDKLGDGKSQAFGNWVKEFLLNVFIQSFHAIVYVICMALIIHLGSASAGGINDNWLLIIIVVTFISKGDDLLRSIFHMKGGGGDTVKGIAATAVQTHAAVKLAGSAKNTAERMFGQDSHVGHAVQGIGNLQSHIRQGQIHRLDESNALLDQTIEEQQAASQHQMADLNAPQTLHDAAMVALDENSTEEQRNEALDTIIAVHNMPASEEKEKALNELANQFKDNPEQLKELEEMMAVRAAANAMMVGGLQPVEFNEKIEIILERMKGSGLAAGMAASILRDPKNLKKIQMAGAIKFKKPDQNMFNLQGLKGRNALMQKGKTGGTRIAGNRYSGTFRFPESVARMNEARAKNMPKQKKTFRQKMVGAGASVVGAGYAIRDKSKMMVARTGARWTIWKQENKASMDLYRSYGYRMEMKKLEKKGAINSARYLQLKAKYGAIHGADGNIARLKAKRAEYAKRGIYFKYVGRTQKTMDMVSGANRLVTKTVRSGAMVKMVYHDVTDTARKNREAKIVAKKARALREKGYLSAGEQRTLKQYEKFIEERTTVGSKLFAARPGEKPKKVRMTSAQRMLNRDRNRISVQAAKEALVMRRDADKARAKGDRALAEKFDKRAQVLEEQVAKTRRTSVRGYDINQSRKTTRAQRILDRGSQRYASKMLREVRKKNPANLSEQERRILDNANRVRRTLRENGVQLTKASSAAKTYNKPTIRMARREEIKAYTTMVGTEIKTASQIIKDRVTTKGKSNGDYTAAKQARQRSAELLKRKGAVIKGPAYIEKVESVADRYDTWNRERGTRKAVKKNFRDTNRTAYNALHGDRVNGTKGILHDIKSAETELNDARKAMRKAGKDVEAMKRAQAREQQALGKLKEARHREQLVYKDIKSARADLRQRDIKLVSPVQSMKNARLEKALERDFARGYENARRQEKVAERRAVRATERVERHEARGESIDTSVRLVSETQFDGPMRRFAKAKGVERAKKAEKPEEDNSRFANRLREKQALSNERNALLASHSAEREMFQDFMRQERIHSQQGFFSRTGEKISDGFGKTAAVYGKTKDFIQDAGVGVVRAGAATYAMGTKIPDEVKAVPSRVSEAISEAKTGIQNTFGRVQDSSNPTRTISLPEEIMQYARNQHAEKERTTINGIYTAPKGNVVPDIPVSVGSTHTRNAETVLVVRDNPSAQRNSASTGNNVITLNTEREVREAKRMAEEAKGASIASGASLSVADDMRIQQLAYSVTAINESTSGEYTASDVVSHIDNIRAIMHATPPGSPAHQAMEEVMRKLSFDLDDYESNVRIQVLNDPSLIAENDPHRTQIMDASIRHVQSLPSDEILLGMLRYEPGDLQEGFTPVARTAKAYQTIEQMAMHGVVTASEESSLQSTLEAAFRQRQREEQIAAAEKGYEASKKAIKSDLFGIAKDTGGAVMDMSVRLPLDVGVGMMSAGVAGGKSGDLLLVSAATASLGGYSLADKAYSGTSKFVTNRVGDVADMTGTIRDKFADSLRPRQTTANKGGKGTPATGQAARKEAIDLRKSMLKDKTSVPSAGSGETLSERLKKINGA